MNESRFRESRSGGYRVVLRVMIVAASISYVAAHAEVKQIVVEIRAPWLGGKLFGAAGAYEKLQGRVVYEIDPENPADAGISDVALAPRNANGKVEFSGDFVVLRPVDAAKARPAMVLEVLNRGHTQANEAFFETPAKVAFRPEALEDVTLQDAMVFEQGFTMAWVSWQFDLPKGPLRLEVPVAPVSSTVLDAFLPTRAQSGTHIDELGGIGSYCAADSLQPAATIRVETGFDKAGTVLPRGDWSLRERKEASRSRTAARCCFRPGSRKGSYMK